MAADNTKPKTIWVRNKTYFRMLGTDELTLLAEQYDLDQWEPAEVQALCAVLGERLDELLNGEEEQR
jgi:hypothetical protein